MVNRISNIDSRLSKLFAYLNAWILELAKGVRIIKVGLYMHLCMCFLLMCMCAMYM